jgi:SAM-dependent methyltransferase
LLVRSRVGSGPGYADSVTVGADADARLLEEQIRYYEARAPIYEQLYFRQGDYAVDDAAWTRNWNRETGELERFVQELPADGSVLELACGNGLWTRFLAPRAERLVAVDASPTMLARNRAWVGDDRVRYVEADLFAWEQDERFDLVFGGFFLSHIPPNRWSSFWGKVHRWLGPGGTIAFVDDCWAPDRPRSSDRVAGGPTHAHIRRLDDEAYTIVKRFFRPKELEAAFAVEGLSAEVRPTGEHFLFGTARP